MKSRFQFTIREMLWATFWAALSCAAWVLFYRMVPYAPTHGTTQIYVPPDYYPLITAAWMIALATPFVAIGVLIRKPYKGLIVGTFIALIAVFLLRSLRNGHLWP